MAKNTASIKTQPVAVPEELQNEIVENEATVTTDMEQVEPVVSRQVEIIDQLRSLLSNLPPGERAVSFALMQELQESL